MLDPAAGLTQVLADGTNTYLYGNGRLAQYRADMQYFGADGLGSVRQLYDASGQVIANNRYDPYGNVMSHSGEATSVFGYTGEQWDAATGLEYLRARYYSPMQGRFFQHDLWPADDLRPQSLNAYSYVRNNPVRYTDPTGQCDPGECTWTSDSSGEWVIADTGVETMPGLPKWDRARVNRERTVSGFNPYWGTYELSGTPSAPYWSLPTRELAWVQWQCSLSDALCWSATNPLFSINSLSRSLALLLDDKGGRYGNFRYRTQRTADECEAAMFGAGFSLALMTAPPMSVGPAPDYFVTPDGVVLPAPKGAIGPMPTTTGRGLAWEGPGGKGTTLNERVTGIRLMDPNKYYPQGYSSYYNATGQAVNPLTGRTLSPSDPWWHIPNSGFTMPPP